MDNDQELNKVLMKRRWISHLMFVMEKNKHKNNGSNHKRNYQYSFQHKNKPFKKWKDWGGEVKKRNVSIRALHVAPTITRLLTFFPFHLLFNNSIPQSQDHTVCSSVVICCFILIFKQKFSMSLFNIFK